MPRFSAIIMTCERAIKSLTALSMMPESATMSAKLSPSAPNMSSP